MTRKRILGGAAALAVVFVVLVVGAWLWLVFSTNQRMARTYAVTPAEISVPYPLSEAERDELLAATERPADVDPTTLASADDETVGPAIGEADEAPAAPDFDAIALERALERGEHIARTRGGCADCHGEDLGGNIVVEDPILGSFVAPNITSGEGGVVDGYTTDDWVRIIRHGINRDGTGSLMPATDFTMFSDQEVSDLVAWCSQIPDVDRDLGPIVVGPMMRVLIATGQFTISAEVIDHDAPRLARPPAYEPSQDFGEHLAMVCAGCHGEHLSGGYVPGGDPSWPPASNLTPHETGTGAYGYAEFERAMRERVGHDGRELSAAMGPALTGMTEVEVQALWAYLQTVEPREAGNR